MTGYNTVIDKLREAVIDEREAAMFYGRMLALSETYEGVEAFAEARKDELDHVREITLLLEELTGVAPVMEAHSVGTPAGTYCEGLRTAIQGEKEAIVEYSEILRISPDPRVNRVISEILADEEVHFAKFNKLYEVTCSYGYSHRTFPEDRSAPKS